MTGRQAQHAADVIEAAIPAGSRQPLATAGRARHGLHGQRWRTHLEAGALPARIARDEQRVAVHRSRALE